MRTTLLIGACVAATLGSAQSSYLFEHTAQQYTTLLAGVPCTMTDGEFELTELDGETFQLHGEPFFIGAGNTVVIGADGYVSFRGVMSRFDVNVLATELEFADPASTVVRTVTGGPGSRVLKVEWRDWGIVNGPPTNILSFQLMIDQATGIIESRFGASALLGPSVVFTDETGPHSGLIHRSNDLSICYEKTWLYGSASDPELDTSTDLDLRALHSVPTSQRVFRFTPDPIASVPSVEESSVQAMVITPVRGGEALSVLLERANGGDLRSYDMHGREVKRWPVNSSTAIISVLEHAPGCYVLRYTDRYGDIRAMRFVR